MLKRSALVASCLLTLTITASDSSSKTNAVYPPLSWDQEAALMAVILSGYTPEQRAARLGRYADVDGLLALTELHEQQEEQRKQEELTRLG